MANNQLYLTLPNGQKMPVVGLGTSKGNPEALKAAIKTALDVGYRLIDTAYFYRNERIVGEALKEVFQEGKIKREDVYIITKLPPIGQHPDRVEKFLRLSLASLQLDYVDQYLLHGPLGFQYVDDVTLMPFGADGMVLVDVTSNFVNTWKKMEEMADLGLARCIGVSNFRRDQIQRILNDCRIKPAIHQFECHAYYQRQQLVDFCKENNIAMCAYAPLGSPGYKSFLAARGIKIDFPILLEDPALRPLCQKYGKTPSQVLLRWLMQRGMSVIPKSENPQRIKENFEVFDFQLNPEDIEILEKLDKNLKMFSFTGYKGMDKHPEFTHGSAE